MTGSSAAEAAVPRTQHAIQFVGPGEIVHNPAKSVPPVGPHQILARVEAVGICFSDTKLLHAFSSHPRKSEVLGGIDPAALTEIPSYVPRDLPTVPGHECACRIVAVGEAVSRHRVGERCLVQTDYRHLSTATANAAFGYNFEGGLQEYVLLDERMIIEPETGERFLIPVGDEPSASAVALLEPWACVEASYVYRERASLRPSGRLAVVVDRGHTAEGLSALVARSRPAAVTVVGAESAAVGDLGVSVATVAGVDELSDEAFDDVAYFGADASTIETLQTKLAPRGLIAIVTGGSSIGRPVAVDVGRIHYDLTRWAGTRSRSAADAYAAVPRDGEVRQNDRMAVVGAAGPMGLMHVVRAAAAGGPGLSIVAVDVDDARLAHLESTTRPIADSRGVDLRFVNSRTDPLDASFDYIALMVPAPPLVGQAVALAAPRSRINIFAGFANRTRAEVDLDRYVELQCYFLGTSGSLISDMKAVLAKLERGELDTNISLDAVTGFDGVADALAAVEARTSGGKIVVYPNLPALPLTTLAELGERYPSVASRLDMGRWTRAAEDELLEQAGAQADSRTAGAATVGEPG